MRGRELSRYAPLAGVVAVVLIVIAFAIASEEPPQSDDSRREVLQFWTDHDTEQVVSSILAVYSSAFLLWFASTIRQVLRAAEEPAGGRLSALSFAGAIIGVSGILVGSTFAFAAAETVGEVPPDVTQTLSVLNADFFFPFPVGFGLFLLATGIGALRTRFLPAWLGWVTVLMGVLFFTPIGFVVFLAMIVWVLVVSILLYRRGPSVGAPAAAPAGAYGPPD